MLLETWVGSIQSLNVSLRDTASHLDDDRMRLQLEAGLDGELRTSIRDANAHEKVSLHPWVSKINDLNNRCFIQRKRIAEQEAEEEATKSNKRPFYSSRRQNYFSTKSFHHYTIVRQSRLPKLTDEEHCLLMEFARCRKC